MEYPKAVIKIGSITIEAPTTITPNNLVITMEEEQTVAFLKGLFKEVVLDTLKENNLI